MNDRKLSLVEGSVIQIAPPHKLAGCVALISKVKTWGVVALIALPDEAKCPIVGAYIRLKRDEFEPIRHKTSETADD